MAWALVPLGVIVARAISDGGTITGAEGLNPQDQFQYLSFIRQAGEHGLIANRMDIGSFGHVFLHPMWLLSGLGWRLGLSLPVALLLWVPISLAVLFAGFRAYVGQRLGADTGSAAAALAIALFFLAPAIAAAKWLDVLHGFSLVKLTTTTGELAPALQTWGYPATALTLGATALVLLGVERIAAAPGPTPPEPHENRHPSPGPASPPPHVAWTAAGALLVAWLHPWEGAELVLVIAGVAAWGRLARLRWLAIPAAGAIAPLLYYWVLGHTDPAWTTGERQSQLPWLAIWPIAVALAPLLPFALLGFRPRSRAAGERILVLWPVAAIAVYLLAPGFSLHALAGLTLPIAVAAARGWRRAFSGPTALAAGAAERLGRGTRAALALAAVALVCVPGMAWAYSELRDFVNAPPNPYLLTASQRSALNWLASHGNPGAVISGPFLGPTVPAFTDRSSWIAHPDWTRDYFARAATITLLLQGRLGAPAARAVLRNSTAAYLLLDCTDHPPATDLPAGSRLAASFGCVRVVLLPPHRA